MTLFARVSVNISSLSGQFDYSIPAHLQAVITAGQLVTVPFGRQTVQGVVLACLDTPAVTEPKPLASLLDPLPVLTPFQLELAHRLAESSLNPLAAIIDLMLPSGLSQAADTLYRLGDPSLSARPASTKDHPKTSPLVARLQALLTTRGTLRGRQIDRHFSHVEWRSVAQTLLRQGVLVSSSVLPPPTVRPKMVRTAQLAVSPDMARAALPTLGKTAATLQRRQAALNFLISEAQEVNVSWVYAASNCTLPDLQELAERDLVALHETELWRDPLEKVESLASDTAPPPPLTPDQQAVWEQIEPCFASPAPTPAPFLIQGVTGSGKTEIYLRATAETIRQGRQVLFLVPEIALTAQTVRRFLARFPGQVGLVHSRLSPGERYDTWRRARLGLLKVVIGPRSALFTPLANIGLIVADECHDTSYHQSEPPCYDAIDAARLYARLCSAVCLLGSATPSVVQRYQAESRQATRLVLPRRIINPQMPPVQVVDMRAELRSGNRGIFSQPLLTALGGVLERNEQAILFLNRRGTATHVFCRTCGTVAICPQCDSPLTLHGAASPDNTALGEELICHRCGYQRHMPAKCPACASPQMRAYGLGSEKVENEVHAHFPSARTLRWDRETTRQKDAHELILSHFAAHHADVLIGTQMLAKGLDLPLVTLVGIVLAEVGLALPDPFAPERTFSLLTQVAGRAGRSSRGGQVILQTFQPGHAVIGLAARHDVDGFYAREVEQRRQLGYPPFSQFVRLEYRHFDPVQAETATRQVAQKLQNLLAAGGHTQTALIGPAPCFFTRLDGLYRWQIVLRGPHPATLLQEMTLAGSDLHTVRGWRVDVDPVSLL